MPDFDSDETSAPVYTHFRANPATTNQSTNDRPTTTHHRFTPKHTPQTTPIHTPQIPQPHSPTKTTPIQPHKTHTHTATQTPTRRTRRRPPPTLTTHREAMPYPDVVAAPMQSQPRTGPQLDRPGTRQDQATAAIGQARQTGSDRTRPDQKQAQAGLDKVRPDRTIPDQVSDRTESGHTRQAVTRQAAHSQTGSGHDVITGQESGRP